jgi:shikimate kinase
VSNQAYRLTVDGELSDQVSSVFAGMTLTRNRGRTILEGPVRDQAELHALLQRVSDLGLTLVSATAVERG